MTLSKMTTYMKHDEQIVQNAMRHLESIQNALNLKDASIKISLTFDVSVSAQSSLFDAQIQKGIFLPSKSLEADLRPRLQSLGFDDQEIDIVFGFFCQNFIVPQMAYETLLSERKAIPNVNYYLATYESVLCAYHYWMDHSDSTEQTQLSAIVKKTLASVKNPVSENEIFSIYIAENQSIIESDFLYRLYLHAYIFNELSEYEEHTSFEDYIGYLLEDLK